MVICETPSVTSGQIVDVKVAMKSDIYYAISVSTFQYYELAKLYFLEPSIGSEAGNTRVIIYGRYFETIQNLQCIFGAIGKTDAIIINSTVLWCLTPAHSGLENILTDTVSVTLTSIEHEYNATNNNLLQYTFQKVMNLTRGEYLYNSFNELLLYGNNFVFNQNNEIICQFYSMSNISGNEFEYFYVSATYLNASNIVCEATMLEDGTYYPVNVSVSSNRQEWSKSILITKDTHPTITRIYPLGGDIAGNANISIYGTDFNINSAIYLNYDNPCSEIYFINATLTAAHDTGYV